MKFILIGIVLEINQFCLLGVLYVWGLIFICVTTLIAIFKKENDCRLEFEHVKLNVTQNYSLLCDILKLPSIRILAVALLTAKVNMIEDLFYIFISMS